MHQVLVWAGAGRRHPGSERAFPVPGGCGAAGRAVLANTGLAEPAAGTLRGASGWSPWASGGARGPRPRRARPRPRASSVSRVALSPAAMQPPPAGHPGPGGAGALEAGLGSPGKCRAVASGGCRRSPRLHLHLGAEGPGRPRTAAQPEGGGGWGLQAFAPLTAVPVVCSVLRCAGEGCFAQEGEAEAAT